MNTFHLLPDGPAWKLTTGNGIRIFRGISDRDTALSHAVNTVSKESGLLKVHGRDGAIQQEFVYPRGAGSVQI